MSVLRNYQIIVIAMKARKFLGLQDGKILHPAERDAENRKKIMASEQGPKVEQDVGR